MAIQVSICVIVILILVLFMWKKAPIDKAFVITGLKRRVISGKGTIVIPVLEQVDKISLEDMNLDVNTKDSLDITGVPLSTDGVAIIKIKNDKQSILIAVEQFNTGKLQTTIDNIKSTSKDVLEGKLREIVSKMTLEDIYKDREQFTSEVENVASTELAKMGLELITFTLRDITDKNGYLQALGAKRIAEVHKNAEIAKAEAKREELEQTAESNRLGKQAQLLAETQIAEAEKDKELKLQLYKQEQFKAQANADKAYDIETNIVQKQVIETEQSAKLLEAIKQTEVTKQDALRKEQELDVNIKKQADAEKYQSEKNAEAQRYIEEQKAFAEQKKIELEAAAKATAIELEAKAKALEIEEIGKAEANAIRAKGEAQADALKAEAQALKEKANVYKEYGNAVILEILANNLPAIAENIAKPLAQTDKMIIIDNGSENSSGGSAKLTKGITNIIAQVPEVVESLTGIDLAQIVKNYTEVNTDV
ncbi:flotillin [Candidatus Epulonipiscioides gigas]|nr:flotillin [Epulopiscium sp. SCG-C07WGA-EpuloA2]